MLGAGLASSPPESSSDFTLQNHDTQNRMCSLGLANSLSRSLCQYKTTVNVLTDLYIPLLVGSDNSPSLRRRRCHLFRRLFSR